MRKACGQSSKMCIWMAKSRIDGSSSHVMFTRVAKSTLLYISKNYEGVKLCSDLVRTLQKLSFFGHPNASLTLWGVRESQKIRGARNTAMEGHSSTSSKVGKHQSWPSLADGRCQKQLEPMQVEHMQCFDRAKGAK